MACLAHSSNSQSSSPETLLHCHIESMKKLQDFVFKVAQAGPNAPLAPSTETLLRDRLRRFVSDYRTPDHPPYSAMIQNAVEELNEKWGSSEESISKYLERRYNDLPWAHSALLKHHLLKTCETGDIVFTRAHKYRLAGTMKLSKPRRRKWRWECERLKHNLRKIRNQRRGKKAKGIKMDQECDEKEENGEFKQDQTKSLLSFVDPTFSLTEHPVLLENGPNAITKADILTANALEHQGKEQSEYYQAQLSSPERPPGFEMVTVKNLCQFGSTVPEPEPAKEVIGSMRQIMSSEPGSATELVTPLKAGNYDALQSENMETPPNQQQALGIVPIAEEVAQSVTKDTKLMRDGRRGRRRKYKLKISEAIAELDPQQQEEEIFHGKKLRKIPRGRPAKAQVAKDANAMGPILPPKVTACRRQGRPLKQRPNNQSPSKQINTVSVEALQSPPGIQKLRILLKQKPEAADVENLQVVDDCREQEFKEEGKLGMHEKMEPCKMVEEVLQKRVGRPPKRRSARLLKKKIKL